MGTSLASEILSLQHKKATHEKYNHKENSLAFIDFLRTLHARIYENKIKSQQIKQTIIKTNNKL